MKHLKVGSVFSGLMFLFINNAFATQSSQVLIMSKQLYAIAQDLTQGLLPSAVLLIAVGMWGMVNVFGKGLGDGVHQLTNIIAVGGIVFFASSMLMNQSMFSALM